MHARVVVAITSGMLVAATAVAVVASRLVGPAIADPEVVRILFAILAVFYAGIALAYTVDGFAMQAFGHTLAGAGFMIVSVGGEGTIAWVGVLLLGGGGVSLLSDARKQGGQGRARN